MVFFSVLSDNITQNTATTKIQLLNNIIFYYLPKTWPQNRKQKMNIRLKTHVYIYDLKKKWYPFYWYIHAYKSTIEIRLNFTIAF